MQESYENETDLSVRGSQPPLVHYIWIGPPNIKGVGIPGQDVAGPIEMAKVNQVNTIFFGVSMNILIIIKKDLRRLATLRYPQSKLI